MHVERVEHGIPDGGFEPHPAHEKDVRRYFGRVCRFTKTFLGSVLLGLVAPFVFLAFRWLPGLDAALAYLGVIMLLFPFATETTLELIGVRNSVRLARFVGVLFIVGGAALLFGVG